MNVTCVDSAGFEDALTVGKNYSAYAVRHGSGSYRIIDDTGKIQWYGRGKFRITGLEIVS
jgi:hypothetical protein